ncbi:MAG: hypothetical protein U0694_05320 [Anaerolineae bacterium]
MSNVAVQFLGLCALIAGVAGGYWLWIRPRAAELSMQSAGLLWLIILTFMGGIIGSSGWWFDEPSSFAWDLPPLASRMLASAGWAFGAASFMTLRQPTARRVRLTLLMLLTYLLPLAIAIIFFHLERFDPNAPITYAFFIFVVAMVIPCIWFLLRPPTIGTDSPQDTIPSSSRTRLWLTLVGTLMGLWGLALFITDSGTDLIWVWPGDLLTSRLIAAMLLTIALAAFYSRAYADSARVALVTIVVYGVGVILSNLASLLADKPMKLAYVVVFGAAALISFGLLLVPERS